MDPSQPQAPGPNDCGAFPEEDEILLQRAVERLVHFGKLVGISPEEMISLLDSGVSVPDLLAFLEWKASETAEEGT